MKPVVFVALFIMLWSVGTRAQQPVQFDVKSLKITKTGINTDAIITMEATGLPAPYVSPLSGDGEALWRVLEGCFPCETGVVIHLNYSSNSNGNFVSGFYPNGSGGNSRVSFTITASAPDISLNPRLSRKKNPLVFTGASVLKGSIELSDTRGVVGVDNDVDLSGTATTEINNFLLTSSQYPGSRRGYSYKSITFSYAK